MGANVPRDRSWDQTELADRLLGMTYYLFETDCRGSDYESMRDLVDNSTQISQQTFARKIGPNQWRDLQRNLGYDRSFPISKDWHVEYYAGTYRGRPAVYLRHSGIEYIFVLLRAR